LNASLHLGEKRLEHLSSWSIKQIFSLVNIFFVNSCPEQELGCFISEHVAVVVDDVIFFRLETRANIFQEIFKDVLRKLGFSKRYFLNRFTIWCLLW
jgi:hypothetical protein